MSPPCGEPYPDDAPDGDGWAILRCWAHFACTGWTRLAKELVNCQNSGAAAKSDFADLQKDRHD